MKAKTILVSLVAMSILMPVLVGVGVAQTKNSATNLDSELKRLMQQWVDAFDKGDGATMDQMEVANLVLVNADGSGGIWHKDGPRAGKQKPLAQDITVGASEVRQFGNTAVLTGRVTRKESGKTDESSETIVWIRQNNKWLIASGQWSNVNPKKND